MARVLEPPAEDIRARMDRMYRPQQRIYDLTRKHYLLGRDRLIAELAARPGQSVLDVGCGTGRNLVLIGRRYPAARLFGLDAAAPMLETAAASLARAGVPARLARGVAEELDPQALFGLDGGFDHVTISYCLSMVDDPAGAVRAAARHLAPGGTLHVVDFGDMAGLPSWFRRLMTAWLARFRVRHRPEVEATLRALEAEGAGRVEAFPIAGRYALLFRLRTRG
jgi:S-adenosylmethionine-diacylgycerolhomoserine-N-methlytransferase